MIIDFNFLTDHSVLEADLCIIGSGPAGVSLANEFRSSNLRVLLLESGGLNIEPHYDALNNGEVTGLSYSGLREGRSRAFGGTSKLWAGQCVRLDNIDFEKRDWVPHSGWPLSLQHLETYYSRAEQFFQVEGQVCDVHTWKTFGLQAPTFDPSALHFKGTVYGPFLDVGKQYMDMLTHSTNIKVLLHATTTDIVAGIGEDSVKQIAFASMQKKGKVKARAVALCCGGIENARLLLLARRSLENAMGPAFDNVGRFLQEHPTTRSARLRTKQPEKLQTLFSLFYRNKRRFFPKIALGSRVQRGEALLNGVAYPVYEYAPGSAIESLRALYRDLKQGHPSPEFGRNVKQAVAGMDQTVGTLYKRFVKGRSTNAVPTEIFLQLSLEQAPNRESRVSLSDKLDALGLPKANVDWRLTELEKRTAYYLTEIVGRELGKSGLAQVEIEPWLSSTDEAWTHHFNDVFHPAGTTRMSTEEKEGVVNPDCQVHGVEGLFVSGSSVFPTCGWANPTLTAVALSIRLADHLKANNFSSLRRKQRASTGREVITPLERLGR